MISRKMIRRSVVFVGALAASAGFALAGASQASADPELCVTGPYGYVTTCADVPIVDVWYDGPRGPWDWDGKPGRGPHGHHH